MSAPTLRRAAAVLVGAALPVLLSAAPALALDDGEVPSHQPLGDTILQFVVAPLGAFLFIAALVVVPTMLRRPRYRPGRPWRFDPLWFAGPDEPDEAMRRTRAGATARGGASAEW